MMSASSIDGPLDSSCVCSTSVASVEKSENVVLERLDLGRPARLDRVERARADERRSSGAPFQPTSTSTVSPSAGRLPTSSPSASDEVGQIPVEAGVEPRREAGGDVGGEDGGREENRVGTGLLDERRERVDARLRKRRRERLVLAGVDLRRRRTRRRARRAPERPGPSTTPAASPSVAAFESTPRPPFSSSPPWCSRKTSDLHRSCLSTTRSRIFCAALPSSSILTWSPRDGGGPSSSTVVFAPASPTASGVDAEVGQRQRLLRLRLRAHDPLERRVARLVDRVRDGDDRRQRRRDDVVAVLGLPLARDRVRLDRERGDLRDQRPAKSIGHRRPEHRAVAVARGLPEQDEIGRLALERARRARGSSRAGRSPRPRRR